MDTEILIDDFKLDKTPINENEHSQSDIQTNKIYLPSLTPEQDSTKQSSLKYIKSRNNSKHNSSKFSFYPNRFKADFSFSLHDFTAEASNLDDDWSKESCSDFFVPVEHFLNKQLKREKSSKRRCSEIVKIRNIENNRVFIENTLKDFDDKINLNLLIKNKDPGTRVNTNTNTFTESCNYRSLIADERKNTNCSRCKEKNRRYEDNYFENSIGFSLDKSKNVNKIRFKKAQLPYIQARSPEEQCHNHSHHYPQNNYQQVVSLKNQKQKQKSQSQQLVPKFSHLFNSDSKTILFSFSSGKKSIISKIPIEVQKRNVY